MDIFVLSLGIKKKRHPGSLLIFFSDHPFTKRLAPYSGTPNLKLLPFLSQRRKDSRHTNRRGGGYHLLSRRKKMKGPWKWNVERTGREGPTNVG